MLQTQLQHIGVDFGAQLAGTTAVARQVEGQLELWQCPKNQPADTWLTQVVQDAGIKVIYLDAPLTLPAVYSQHHTPQADYFFRQADRELKAMSPMFVGGLTARAMQLRAQWATLGIATLETYPSALARSLFPELEGYKKSLANLANYIAALQGFLPIGLTAPPANWHQFDALLAWLSGYRHQQNQAQLYGQAQEGRIIV